MAVWHFEFEIDGKFLERAKLAIHGLRTTGPVTCTPVIKRGAAGRAGGQTLQDVVIEALSKGPQPVKAVRSAVVAANFSPTSTYKTLEVMIGEGLVKKNKSGLVSLAKSKKGK